MSRNTYRKSTRRPLRILCAALVLVAALAALLFVALLTLSADFFPLSLRILVVCMVGLLGVASVILFFKYIA